MPEENSETKAIRQMRRVKGGREGEEKKDGIEEKERGVTDERMCPTSSVCVCVC